MLTNNFNTVIVEHVEFLLKILAQVLAKLVGPRTTPGRTSGRLTTAGR